MSGSIKEALTVILTVNQYCTLFQSQLEHVVRVCHTPLTPLFSPSLFPTSIFCPTSLLHPPRLSSSLSVILFFYVRLAFWQWNDVELGFSRFTLNRVDALTIGSNSRVHHPFSSFANFAHFRLYFAALGSSSSSSSAFANLFRFKWCCLTPSFLSAPSYFWQRIDIKWNVV